MKRLLLFLMVFISLFTLSSCNETAQPTVDPTEPTVETPTQGETKDPTEEKPTQGETNDPTQGGSNGSGFAIHYLRPDGQYDGWNLWLWVKDGQGAAYQFNVAEDETGVTFKTSWADFGIDDHSKLELGFIVRKGEWEKKDIEEDRFIEFSKLTPNSEGVYNIYVISGDAEFYTSPVEVNDVITYFAFEYVPVVNKLRIKFETNNEYSEFVIKSGNTVIVDNTATAENDENVYDKTATSFTYRLSSMPNLDEEVTVEIKFKETGETLKKAADVSAIYASPAFEKQYSYDGDLGALYTKSSTTFRVWSPVSRSIKLRIYRSGTPVFLNPIGNDNYEEYEMTRGEKGTWEYTVNGDLGGYYYTYFVTNSTYPKGREVVDPYAKSTGVNGIRGMVVDFEQTNPEGWEDVKVLDINPTSLTVYETHVADLTSSSTWGGTAENATLFTGFFEAGTTYKKGNTVVSTGFDHIKELGVNAVQLLPIFDSANEERPGKRAFNWGYNPLNYNTLDGQFSTDPYNGYTRIKEFKQLVQAYNAAGINIIMDVVYNHTSSLAGTNFDVLMPGYYFRYNGDTPSNGSGCGNETASNMYMFKKFMVDSTEFWASEYKLGGFRFDLMAVHDTEAMDALAKNLHENVSESVVVYGEPWTGGSTAIPAGFKAASQDNMNLYKGYGCFNDKMRDGLIKGGMKADTETGWITNSKAVNGTDLRDVKNGIKGLILNGNVKYEPEKAVQYVTCHDNYTLYDRIKATGLTDEATVKKMAILAQSVVFTSQGIGFMLAGEELLRTKDGNHNSYNASYEVNEINYDLKVKNIEMMEVYKKLIALKQNGNILGLDGNACKNITINSSTDGSLIWYDLVDASTNTTYRIIHNNGASSNNTVNLAGFTLYLDTLNSGVTFSSSTQIKPYQTIIATKKA